MLMMLSEWIPDSLSARAIPLTDIGINSVGWSRSDALEVLRAVSRGGVAVLGGDVLLFRRGILQSTVDSWHSDRRDDEPVASFVKRSIRESEEYLRAYPDPDDGSVLYDLVFDPGAS
jgi:hypothetical protein